MRRIWIVAIVGIVAVGMTMAIASHASEAAKRQVAMDLDALPLPAYAPQRVVYQVNEGGGWFGHGFGGLINSLENHVAAIRPGAADIRVVIQSKGLDLLRAPNEATRHRLDTLRAEGVRFVVCRNSLVQTGTEPSDLYGVTDKDIVRAGVAEIAMLEAQGYVYLHP